jgi:membrane-associated phospholipid phosphatase
MLTTSVRLRLLAVVGWIFVAVAVAFSRVEVGVHWTTDVLASLLFAGAWLLVIKMLFGAAVAGASRVDGVTSSPGAPGLEPSASSGRAGQ